jgi:hypothetical protein
VDRLRRTRIGRGDVDPTSRGDRQDRDGRREQQKAHLDPAATVSLADPTARVWHFNESSPELDAVVACYRDDPAAGIWVFAQPERSKELETVLVPKDAREWRTYDGYRLRIELDQLLSDFELLPPVA